MCMRLLHRLVLLLLPLLFLLLRLRLLRLRLLRLQCRRRRGGCGASSVHSSLALTGHLQRAGVCMRHWVWAAAGGRGWVALRGWLAEAASSAVGSDLQESAARCSSTSARPTSLDQIRGCDCAAHLPARSRPAGGRP